MTYHQTVDFWFNCLQYVGLYPGRPKKWVFIIMLSGGVSFLTLAFADFVFNSEPSYTHAVESIVMFTHVRCLNLTPTQL